jgi:hypothetical protein
LEQQSGAFVTAIVFALPTVGQRKVTRQTVNKALRLALRMTFELKAGRVEIKACFPFRRIGLDEPSPMRIRIIALLNLTVLFGLELLGREPIKSPPPVNQLAEVKVVRARDLSVI